MEMYVVESYPKGWDEPFKREYFDEKKYAQEYAVRMNLYYPRVLVMCEVYENGKLGCVDSYPITSLTAKR